ncbi:Gfo/Idh/MocA family protein [Agrilactobacillus fermenti]|uniref:Gfo/Idh/MocA family protein n=1 Tax=Agrilactobacillus fermenti TaxID=2586909 RepID=UPI001E2ACBAB|nr:Gfo/Idh/MocA family oxidoreductase [Agrilactobacillus fermenti]MCD2255160.1 Gfo/Idh/MocA family oxidoreductase [Agrilactobacillus fermenti]
MLKLAIIGTNWITGQFIDAALATKAYELTTIYSRHLDKAQAFTEKYTGSFEYFDDLTAFFQQGDFDVVYIASPNALHFEQTKQAILAGKHVIVEKPAFSNPDEMKQIQSLLAAHPDIYYFEAARHIHEPNFRAVQAAITAFDHQDGAVLTYMKYSSRFDDFLAGKQPNIFSAQFSGGALQDLGVYLVYDALSWFGVPKTVQYAPVMLNSGVDARGTALLNYGDFQVTLITGKNVQSALPSEIYSGKTTLTIDNAGEFNQVTLQTDPKAAGQTLSTKPSPNPMIHEAEAFATIMQQQDRAQFTELNQLSVAVNQTLYDLRTSAGIVFPADMN